ncbi:MAG: hypothetical protein ACOCW6_04555 [Spirochaetota bacterium]
MRLLTTLTLGVALLLGTGVAFAQQALDDGTINRWADSMEEIQEWGESQDDFENDFENPEDPLDFEGSFAEAARRHAEVRRIIARHGFSDGDEWAAIGARVLNAYGAMRIEEEAPDYRQEMEAQLREIENSPHLTPEQKQMMRQQMEQAMQMMEGTADAPPADIAAVRGNRARLDRLFEDE